MGTRGALPASTVRNACVPGSSSSLIRDWPPPPEQAASAIITSPTNGPTGSTARRHQFWEWWSIQQVAGVPQVAVQAVPAGSPNTPACLWPAQ